ncbi:hypothetical protein BO94DRAFT_475973 [Aspergillus sclerotioniger CBS 115572]|uniref:Methyltransferase type 11 domain-containing protein n=1 Tax=Aspergillus sclerotioniger CBS 115572 TaxID=1450535 RepID=A0A317VJQ5_9EURO|nr:hypothetical protein BO94DRAFT_475973 [Aspergillus sclerotioniger CBS 115572]PWY72130.1 hypothetical protein BO94DRAFT_475973 [Aspergillus sclerotioniger CBS 115572]
MTDVYRPAPPRCPPLRQVRGTRLDTIEEDAREAQYSESTAPVVSRNKQTTPQPPQQLLKQPPQLKLKTSGLQLVSSRLHRFFSPISAGSLSSCSDTEWQRQMQPFEDLYDATDEDSDISDECTSFASTRPTSLVTPTTRTSVVSPISRSRYPSLTIPSSTLWPSLHGAPKSSPIPPTPPPKIPVSPTALSMLTHSVPAVHAPPSLDGSVSSDQVSNISAPATPDLQSLPDNDWTMQDVQMLRHISLDGTPDPWSETSERNEEMWQLHLPPERPRSADDATPASELSGYSFSQLSIPSPGGFFASLGPRSRHTWSIPHGNMPPSSAIAESFYKLPFARAEGQIVEQVIDYPDRTTEEQLTAVYDPIGPPTAFRIPAESLTQCSEEVDDQECSDDEAMEEAPIPAGWDDQFERDEDYESELRQKAMSGLDRTSDWLSAQASYLAALHETNPVNMLDGDAHSIEAASKGEQQPQLGRKRSVPYAGIIPEAPSSQPSAQASKDSIYWRGFQAVQQQSSSRDTFVHRNTRFDAIQSTRLGLTGTHINRLRGNYEISRPERPAYKGPFSLAPRKSTMGSALAEKAQFSMVEKEQAVLSQIRQPMWAMDALRYVNGGSLIVSPASKRLASTSMVSSRKAPRQLRILDLGGHASCEWAWQLAHEYPHVKVYTVFTEHQAVNPGIKGPPNHRHMSVSQLWKLPFPDNKFDVISARSFPVLLKKDHPAGETQDQYDLCLKECRRCLKPGGYLEFFVMDAEITRAGPQASATSAEFASNLRAYGYDPTPTKGFLSRLQRNFADVKRAWMFLPMGTEPVKSEPPRETPDPRVKSLVDDYEAVHGPVGSTADVANVTGMFGGWLWEQWLVKLQMEMGMDQQDLLAGIGGVFDEGRKNGAGWTCLSGWAMKPRLKKKRHGRKSSKG